MSIKVVRPRNDAVVDIVAVHGLNGDATDTWTDKSSKKCWLSDDEFMSDSFKKARVLSFGYNANVFSDVVIGRVATHANNLLDALTDKRIAANEQRRPIIFVAHSLGGIVVKRALIAAKANAKHYGNIVNSTVAIIFLGTPHNGADLSGALQVLQKLYHWGQLGHNPSTTLTRELEPYSHTLCDINTDFTNVPGDKIEIVSFFEQKETWLPPPYKNQVIVPEGSAKMNHPQERPVGSARTHQDLCKFASPTENDFVTLQTKLDIAIQKVIAQSIAQPTAPALTDDDAMAERFHRLPRPPTMGGLRDEITPSHNDSLNARQDIRDFASKGQTFQVKESGLRPLPKASVKEWDERERQDFLDSIAVWEDVHLGGDVAKAQGRTCTWVREHEVFQQWQRQPEADVLCILGPSGCGKSVLARFLSSKLEADGATVHTFYCKGKANRDKDPPILEMFVHRLLDTNERLFRHVQAPNTHVRRSGAPPSADLLWSILENILKDPDLGQVYLVIDALNECQQPFIQRFLHHLEQLFGNVADTGVKAAGLAKVILTCVPVGAIPSFATKHPVIDLWENGADDGNARFLKQDIKTVVQLTMDEISQSPNYTGDLKDYAISRIQYKANGMFIYVDRALAKVRDVSFEGDQDSIKATLEALPADMDEYYDQAFTSIPPDHLEDIRRVFMLLFFANRSLTLEELAEALSMQAHPKCKAEMRPNLNLGNWLQVMCGQLLSTNGTTYELRHDTLRQYLLHLPQRRVQAPLSRFQYDGVSSNLEMATICLRYLEMDDFGQGWSLSEESIESLQQHHPFYGYAAGAWPIHVKRCGDSVTPLVPALLRFLKAQSQQFLNWQLHFCVLTKVLVNTSKSKPILHLIAAADLTNLWPYISFVKADYRTLQQAGWTSNRENQAFSFWEYVPWIPERFRPHHLVAHVDETDDFGWTALDCAASNGHPDAVTLLLRDGAVIDSGSPSFATPLHFAITKGDKDVVRVLLENNANVAAINERANGATTLHLAAMLGRTDILKQLLERTSTADLRDAFQDTPMHDALQAGHTDCAALLLDAGADPEAIASNGWRPLQSSATDGWASLVQRLLARGAMPDVPDSSGFAALHYAAQDGHEETARILLQEGHADIDLAVTGEKGSTGWTSLHLAASGGHAAVVQLLIREGADVTLKTTEDQTTAFDEALSKHNQAVMTAFIEAGAVELGRGANATPPLYRACLRGHEDIARHLIEIGAEVNLGLSESHINPLHAAAWENHVGIVRMLLARPDINVDARTIIPIDWTPLFAAATKGHLEVVRLLLEKDADPNACDSLGNTPLDAAVGSGDEEVASLLVQFKAKVMRGTISRNNALHEAATRGQSLTVAAILASEPNVVDVPNTADQTPLWIALAKGHENIAGQLLQNRAEPEALRPDGLTSLHAAVLGGNMTLTRQMMVVFPDIDVTSKNDVRPLHYACWAGNIDVVKLLLEQGADPQRADSGGSTPLHEAAARGHISVMEALLDRKVDVEAEDKRHYTALVFAAEGGHADAVRLLLQHRVGVRGGTGPLSAIYIAAKEGHHAVVSRLLEAEANMEEVCEQGLTPLTVSLTRFQTSTTQALVLAGANIETTDDYGQSAIDFAWTRTAPPSAAQLQRRRPRLVDSVRQLIREILDNFALDHRSFHSLGDVLLLLDRSPDAQIAFDRRVLISDDKKSVEHQAWCNECGPAGGNIKGARWACRYCPDTDLCDEHRTAYDKGMGRQVICRGHSFFRIPHNTEEFLAASEASDEAQKMASIRAWLESLLEELAATTVSLAPPGARSTGPTTVFIPSSYRHDELLFPGAGTNGGDMKGKTFFTWFFRRYQEGFGSHMQIPVDVAHGGNLVIPANLRPNGLVLPRRTYGRC